MLFAVHPGHSSDLGSCNDKLHTKVGFGGGNIPERFLSASKTAHIANLEALQALAHPTDTALMLELEPKAML